MTKKLELKRTQYGELAQGVEFPTSEADMQVTVSDELMAVIWNTEDNCLDQVWVLDLSKTTLKNAIRRLKHFAKSVGVESTKVKTTWEYGGPNANFFRAI